MTKALGVDIKDFINQLPESYYIEDGDIDDSLDPNTGFDSLQDTEKYDLKSFGYVVMETPDGQTVEVGSFPSQFNKWFKARGTKTILLRVQADLYTTTLAELKRLPNITVIN